MSILHHANIPESWKEVIQFLPGSSNVELKSYRMIDRRVGFHHGIGIGICSFGFLCSRIKVFTQVCWVQNLIFWYVIVQLSSSDDYRSSLNPFGYCLCHSLLTEQRQHR